MTQLLESDVSVKKKLIWISVVPAVAILFAGYIPMVLFWRFGHYPPGIRGLFSFHDATWGDGLLLPALALFLSILTRRLEKVPARWPTRLAVAGGAIAAGLLILTWWADPDPAPDWTLPQPHDFTFAGEWHAAFVVAGSAFFAAFWVELVRRLRAAGRQAATAVLASPVTAGAVACTAGYAWLAAVDSAHSARRVSGLGTLVALIVAAVVLIACLAWAARVPAAVGIRSATAGLLIATMVVTFVDTYGHTRSFMLLSGLAILFAAIAALVAILFWLVPRHFLRHHTEAFAACQPVRTRSGVCKRSR